MILSIDAEACDKIQQHFMTKAPKKLGIGGMFLNMINIYNKPAANVILKMQSN
jgi:hypothetical protein